MRFLDNISIKRRIAGAAAIVVFAFCAMTWFSAQEIIHVTKIATTIYEHPLEVSNAALAAMAETRNIQEQTAALIAADDAAEAETAIANIEKAENGVLKHLDIVKEHILGEKGQLLEKETRELFLQRKPVRDRAIALYRQGKKRQAAAIIKKDRDEHFSRIYAKEAELNAYARNKATAFIGELNTSVRNIQYRELAFLVLGVLLSAAAAWVVFRSVFVSLKRLRDSMDMNAEYGSLSEAEATGRNEIADMARSFNSLVRVVNKHREDLESLVRTRTKDLEESREWFSTTLRSIGDAVIATDGDGRISFMNPAAEKLTGWPSEDAHGKPLEAVFKIVNEDTREPVENPAAKVIETGVVVGLANHTVLISRDGKECPIVDSGAPIISPDGEIIGVALVFMDDTERRRAENALRESEFFLRESQKAAMIGSYNVDFRTGLWKSSATLDEIFGIDADYDKSIEGWLRIVNPEHREMMDKYLNDLLSKKGNFEKEYKIRRINDGAERWVLGFGAVRYEEDGTPIDMTGTIQDVTERKRAEEMREVLHEQEKFAPVGKVAGKLAHDFNNMLGIIVGTSELLLAGNLPEETEEEIRIIKASALKGRDITKNLLLFAKDQETKYTQFDINEKIGLLLNTLKADLGGIQVTVEQGAGLNEIVADAGMIENALINLIQNSLHAMSKTERPKLKIRTYEEAGNIFVEITDNGCGVPPEYREKIFEPSVTLKGSGDMTGAYGKDIKGSGYGLSNVRRCAEKHGGEISFESGGGETRFLLSIPVIKRELTREELITAGANRIEKGKRVLVVEDEPHLGRILYMLLSNFGHNVHLASDGKMAVEHLKNNCYDAVTLDYLLPDMTGLDIYREIRGQGCDTPVLFVSGNFEFMQSMMDLKKTDPKVDHIAKPFEGVDFVTAVNNRFV